MQGLPINVAGRDLLFAIDGNVMDAGMQAVIGAWNSESPQKDNEIGYTADGAAQIPLAAKYSFNDSNQLQVQLANADGSLTDAVTLVGGIEIDDDHDLNYILLDNAGNKTGAKLTIYGDLQFAQDTNNLTIALAGGGRAAIQGLNGVQSLQAEKNHIAAFRADDLLIFHAETDNDVGQPDLLVVPAKIDFVGNWDIQQGRLVFMSNIKSSSDSNQVSIGFAGKLAGVTAGFVYFADADKTQVALNITGQHVFKADKSETDLSWQSSIGFTGKTFSAQVNVDSVTNFVGGQSLSIKGSLTLQQANGEQLEMDLSLEAQYSFDTNNILIFKAAISEGSTPSYDLMLQGTFKYSNLNMTFTAEYTNKAGATDLTVSVGITGDRNSMIQKLALVLDVSESEAKLKLDLTFEVHLQFADGVRVKTKPQLAQGAGGNG